MKSLFRALVLVATLIPQAGWCQANGKLQIHFMAVGQGDGALLITPLGETVLFDNGHRLACDKPFSYLDQLGLVRIDYFVASHYHDDHIGCATKIFQRWPVQKKSFDRGGHYRTATFTNYTNAVKQLRTTATEGLVLSLDQSSPNRVSIEFVALNGDALPQAKDENDLSVVCVVRFGQFDAVIGGDLSGVTDSKYFDAETSVAPRVGQVEVYKVNHHGSKYSSNPFWLGVIKPKIGIISCGDANIHHHPTPDCLARLHHENVITFWTSHGNGVQPNPAMDKVGTNIIVEISPGSTSFTVAHSGDKTNSYQVWNPITPGGTSPTGNFAWSKNSGMYHFDTCQYVENISPANLQTGTSPPAGKTLHPGCPK